MKLPSSLQALRRRRTRGVAYAAVALLLVVGLAFGAVTASPADGSTTSDDGRFTVAPEPTGTDGGTDASTTNDGQGEEVGDGVRTRNRTGVLVTVQSYGGFSQNNGRAVLVRDGEVVWSFAPANSRVFDAEMLENGNVLVSYATALPASECPERTLEYHPNECVRNNVVEIEFDSKDVVWEHRWYDAYITHHEVHDADRLPSGETVIIDMGNDRTFVVAENGSVVWEWSAREHMGPGSAFWEKYGGPEREGPESDWTHMNDVDRTDEGNFLMSIRNFDVVVEVNRSTKEIVHVTGEPRDGDEDVPGREPVLNEQHNPMLVDDEDAVLVADSEADRVVEVNRSTGAVEWTYTRELLWPRDADRLPNGNTLVTNSLSYEVLEVTPDGDIVWSHTVSWNGERGIPYEADRVVIPEEPDGMPGIAEARADDRASTSDGTGSARTTAGSATESGGDAAGGLVDRYRGYALLYLPGWMGAVELWLVVGLVVLAFVAVADGVAYGVERARTRLAD